MKTFTNFHDKGYIDQWWRANLLLKVLQKKAPNKSMMLEPPKRAVVHKHSPTFTGSKSPKVDVDVHDLGQSLQSELKKPTSSSSLVAGGLNNHPKTYSIKSEGKSSLRSM